MTKRNRTTDTTAMAADLIAALGTLRPLPKTAEENEAFDEVATFCSIALKIIADTNPSKVRDHARALEIASMIAPAERVVA